MHKILLQPFIYIYKFILLLFKLIISFLKYFFMGIYFCIRSFIKFIFKFVYYLIYGLIAPFALTINLIIWIYKKTEPNRKKRRKERQKRKEIRQKQKELLLEKRKIREARRIRLEEKKSIKNEEEKQRKRALLEEKQKQKREISALKKEKKKKENDVYINENVKIDRNSTESVNNLFKKIKNIPKAIGDKFRNNEFVKNHRNKKDMKHQALLINFEGEDAEKSDTKLLYQYVAKDTNGKVIKGYFEAFSKVEVHSFLLSEGYEVYSIKTNKLITFWHGRSKTNKTKFKNKDLVFFITQLSTYLKAGIPLVEALKILSRQFAKNKKYNAIFKSIIYDLTMGENFSDSLLKQGNAFPRLLINMIKTAEMTGELPEVLDDMYVYYTESEKTRKQMITALMYPSIVFVFATGVIVFILMYVIPQFVEIYATMDAADIPVFTKIVIAASDFLKHNILWVLLGIVIFVIINVYLYKKVKLVRTLMQWVAMHVPVFGNTIIYNEVTMFTKTFGSLLEHNVFITESMDVLNKMTNNEIYKMLILDTITNLAKGDKISKAFENHWAFPLPAYEMLVTGEKTGELADMMIKVSEYYQELHKEQVARIKTFIEPLLTVFLTFMVGIIILAIVLPMFGMYETVQNY